MTWSTRQLADLAGTTVKAVRYYHQIGLLEEPDRAVNGYKRYGVDHLVRLLRVRRFVDLGVPPGRIAELGDLGHATPDALRALDEELAGTVERLQRVRAEIAGLLRDGGPADLPTGFGAAGAELSEADRAMVLIYSRVFTPAAVDALRDHLLRHPRTDAERAFSALPADADEETRDRLVEQYAEIVAAVQDGYAWLGDPSIRALPGNLTRDTVNEALTALYNPAQLDVLVRAQWRVLERDAGPTEG